MLPHHIDRPEFPIGQFPSNNPPSVPNIRVLPEAEPVLPYAAAAVANEAGRVAQQSVARMFCYNMLCAQHWGNAQFDEVVKLTCDAAVIRVRSGQANAVAGIILECAIEVLTLYASMLVISYPDLARAMPPEAVNASASNHRVYTDLLEDSKQMYAEFGGYNPPRPPQTHFGRRGTPTAVHAHANPAAAGAYLGQRQPAVAARPLPKSVQRLAAAEQPANAAPVLPEIQLPTSDLTGDIEKMDRSAHAVVYYGKTISVATAPLRRKMEEAVEKFEELAEQADDAVSLLVNEVILPAQSLDELVVTALGQWVEEMGDGLTVYMRKGWVMTPIASAISMETCFDEMAKCATFAAIASVLQKTIENETDKVKLRQTLCYVAQIDRVLTRILNDFLTCMTDLEQVEVTSFVEDAPSMSRYLNEKYKGEYNSAYTEYQKKVVCKLFSNARNAENPLSDVIDSFDSKYADFLTEVFSLTYIAATASELGYSADASPKKITLNSTPMLRRLVTALTTYELKRDMPANHLVILADGTRYVLYPVSGATDEFTLAKV